MLQEKYKLINKKTPFIGNKSASFSDGDVLIVLCAPHMRFDMEMNYFTKGFLDTVKGIKEKQIQSAQKNEISQL